MFALGALSIWITLKLFSCIPIDLTLEQTINKDVASRHSGIVAFTQNVNARKRWTVTRSIRGSTVAILLEMAGLTVSEEAAQELKPMRIARDNSDLDNIIKEIEDTLNPYTVPDDACTV